MLRTILICVAFVVIPCLAEQAQVRIAPEKAIGVGNELFKCAIEQGGEVNDLIDQLYNWKIRDEAKAKNFLFCMCTNLGVANKDGKLVVSKILDITGDFKTKDKYVAMINDCNSKATGKDNKSVLFSVAKCYQKNTPVVITV